MKIKVCRFTYRQVGKAHVRDKFSDCEVERDASYEVGDVWTDSRGTAQKLIVCVAVDYFDRIEMGKHAFERLMHDAEQKADQKMNESAAEAP